MYKNVMCVKHRCVCISTDELPVHVNCSPSLDSLTEEKVSEQWLKAARIVSKMKTPTSKIAALLQRLKQNLCGQEKDEVRDELKKEISAALKDGGIAQRMIHKMTSVFVNMSIDDIELVHVEPGASIILYLKCGSVESLLSLKEMILSGLLLRLFSEVIKEFIESRPRVQLIVKAEDYNLTLTYLNSVDGKFVSLL